LFQTCFGQGEIFLQGRRIQRVKLRGGGEQKHTLLHPAAPQPAYPSALFHKPPAILPQAAAQGIGLLSSALQYDLDTTALRQLLLQSLQVG
jgi:hypothetical protein